jgi:hypothetical protein
MSPPIDARPARDRILTDPTASIRKQSRALHALALLQTHTRGQDELKPIWIHRMGGRRAHKPGHAFRGDRLDPRGRAARSSSAATSRSTGSDWKNISRISGERSIASNSSLPPGPQGSSRGPRREKGGSTGVAVAVCWRRGTPSV